MPSIVPPPISAIWGPLIVSGVSSPRPHRTMNSPPTAITTTLFRIGVHIGAAKCPRVLSTAAISAAMPKKKIVGRIRYPRVVSRPRVFGVASWAASTIVSSGAQATAITVETPRLSTPRVSRRCAYASPPSASLLRARTSSGTITLARMPPSSSS